jgi:hypothetical protein
MPMKKDKTNPMGIPIGGWIDAGDLRGLALPTPGTAAALIEAYRGKSGGRDAETSVLWSRGEPYVHFCSDRGPDVIAVLRRAGDQGIYAFSPPQEPGDTLFLYLRPEVTRRAWAIVRATRGAEEGDDEDQLADAGDEAADDGDSFEVEDMPT